MACHSLPDLVAAVRSSAVDEDGAVASFAGQHETYLIIVGGMVAPDTFVVRKSDLAVISRVIADTQRMTVPALHISSR